jgi:hypothetical protein
MRSASLATRLVFACALVVPARPAVAAPPLIVPDVRESAPLRIVDSSTNVLVPPEPSDFIDIVCFAFVNDGPRTAVKATFDVTLVDTSGTVLAVQTMKPAGRFERGIDDAYIMGGRWLYACISFTNLAPKVARRVRADVTILDRGGTVVNVEHIAIADRIKPNDPLTNQRGSCLSINGRFDGDTYLYEPRSGTVPLGRVIVSPGAIEFEDGSTWTAPPPPPIGSRATFP